jgi:nucleolar protein 4
MAPERYFTSAMEEKTGTSSSSSQKVTLDSKGKGREPKPQTTLFVSSLPFTATSTDLSTLFSDIGPLRRAFVVTDKDTGKSKGVGYVTFAVLEDAERAEKEMQGRSLDGKRKMRIEWAEKKAFGGRKKVKPEEDGHQEAAGDIVMLDVEKEESLSKPNRTTPVHRAPINRAGDEKDENAVRTIVVTGLSACTPAADDKTIYKRARKIGDVENVIYPAPLSIVSTSLSQDVAHVIYRTPNHAMTAVEKLHAHTFKGAQLSVVLKKRADGVAKLDARMRPETKEKSNSESIKKKKEFVWQARILRKMISRVLMSTEDQD